MKKMPKIICILFSCILLSVLFGCGQNAINEKTGKYQELRKGYSRF